MHLDGGQSVGQRVGSMVRGSLESLASGGRPTCYACFRPKSHCICGSIKLVEAHCNILILQHPNEYRKYYSTAPLVTKALSNASIVRGIEFPPGEIEAALIGQRAYLLYPSPQAKDCEKIELSKSDTVVVVDGTWDEAGKLVYRNQFLKTLPHLTFNRPLRSNYRIRKQPREHYLSTIESVGHLLQLNAAASGKVQEAQKYEHLFEVFDLMVSKQLRYFPRAGRAESLLKDEF